VITLLNKRILIVDRQNYWRQTAAEVLAEKGCQVLTLDHYDYAPTTAYFNDHPPDLIILGCATITREEHVFIQKVLEDNCHLLVLCLSLPWTDMRALFLAGADDVADKTYDPVRLVDIVRDAFENVSARQSEDEG
jgi:DNA-binding response OmpR family regulator